MAHKKQIFKANTLKKLLGDENSCVSLVPNTRLLALPPFFLNDMKSGILYLLNNMLKKYDRSLGGIVIGYQNIKVLMDENTGIIPMGTSETEVNISVEFYIFQPKIGSFLEGVVNKKSNSHIGCLVHRYFNATILKPEDVGYDEWICQRFNVDDKIIFKVKDLDFTILPPYIEGVVDNERCADKVECNLSNRFDEPIGIVNNKYPNEVSFSENERKHKKNKKSVVKDSIGENSFELNSSPNLKKKKRKKKEKELLKSAENNEQTEKCVSSNEAEDEIFYSTQLDFPATKKMRISCCSPITKNTSFEEKTHEQYLNNQYETNEKKKHKESKRESKKSKTSRSDKEKTKSDECMTTGETTIDETSRKQVTEEVNKSDREKSKKRKKKKDALNVEENRKGDEIRTNETQPNVEVDSMLDELRKQEIQKVMEELNISDKESFKEPKKKKLKVKKEEQKAFKAKNGLENSSSLNKSTNTCVNGDKEKVTVQNMMDHLLKEEMNRLKDDSKTVKKEKKTKKALNGEKETSKDVTHDSLYEKLLKEAKSAMDVEKDASLTLPIGEKSKKKKKKDQSKSFLKALGLTEKKEETSLTTNNRFETPEKYKNGSMYDVAFTPEKVTFDKSLFSDSEQSNASPSKKKRKINAEITSKKVTEPVEKRLGKEKESKNSNSEQEQEFLYERLLSEAKNLFQSPNEGPVIKKKRKTGSEKLKN